MEDGNIAPARYSLVWKVILTAGATLFLTIIAWSYFNIRTQRALVMDKMIEAEDRLGTTILLGTQYAMMTNSRDDIAKIINDISSQPEIESIRIYNKEGEIKYSNDQEEIDRLTNIKDEACFVCHRTDPPLTSLDLKSRTRIIESGSGYRRLGVLSPIFNEPGCSTDSCHFHPASKKVLGALDVVVSLAETDREMEHHKTRLIVMTVLVFLVQSLAILFLIWRFVSQPIGKLIAGTKTIAAGGSFEEIAIQQGDEMGQLASSINKMNRAISEKQAELNRQKDEYQSLFELVPCIVTVQDRDYRLLRFNREFAEIFSPEPGDFCYHAYKGRDAKCEICPVEKTFEDGECHISEETGVNRDGTMHHWIVKTSPIRDENGRITAAMEMCLDITSRRVLEQELEKSEQKYHAIFDNIPNSVFVVNQETFEILDCNESVRQMYGWTKEEIIGTSFLDLFTPGEKARYSGTLADTSTINQARQRHKDGRSLYVSVRISPSDYPGRRVLLISTSDITKRLEAEQQLIQAGKMATLGEMATGVAHELNQPLSVIKTASNFFMKKIRKNEPIKDDILLAMAEEIDSHVDRATKIIRHMRDFGRKEEMTLEEVWVNEVVEKAFEIFSQQLKLREIRVDWRLTADLPPIHAQAGKLEQVFINLLINARDAIESRWEENPPQGEEKKIVIESLAEDGQVCVRVSDNGPGIPPGLLDKIFEPFFTTKEVGKGTGLGLSISYGLVKDFDGSITALSPPQGGAAFEVRFPAPEED